mmetsp:Transcript_68434/g.222653  ORF Transcript_68434/g.222653 Transcript_68434/m.222653 type:complete len:179 (-) Transcript_68434:18-554(-)
MPRGLGALRGGRIWAASVLLLAATPSAVAVVSTPRSAASFLASAGQRGQLLAASEASSATAGAAARHFGSCGAGQPGASAQERCKSLLQYLRDESERLVEYAARPVVAADALSAPQDCEYLYNKFLEFDGIKAECLGDMVAAGQARCWPMMEEDFLEFFQWLQALESERGCGSRSWLR